MLNYFYKAYIGFRNLFYKKELIELAKIKYIAENDFSIFSGIKATDFSIYTERWENFIKSKKNKIDYSQLKKEFAIGNATTNIKDQLSRVDLYKSVKNIITDYHRKIVYLDFGCGTATLSYIFTSSFERAYFLDLQNASKDFLLSRVKKDELQKIIMVGEPRSIDLIADNSLDLVLVVDVLEHLKNPSIVIKKIDSKLKRKGKIIMRAPWGDTFLGKHPDHNLFARKEFVKEGGEKLLRNGYRYIRPITALDIFYRQGLFIKK